MIRINLSFQRDMMDDDEEGSLKDFIDDDDEVDSEVSSSDSDRSFNSSGSESDKKLGKLVRRTRATAKDCKCNSSSTPIEFGSSCPN